MSNLNYNANSSGYTSELRQQNMVETIREFKSSCAEKRKSVVEVPARESGFYNKALSSDLVNHFCGVKFSEQRYASAKCRIDIAKSHLYSAKKHLKKRDYIAMLSYMHCSMNHASRAMLELNKECDEKHIDIIAAFERMYIHTKLFSRNNFLFWQKISYVFDKIVRGDFFGWPRESFSEDLRRTSIFIGAAEEVFLCYYMVYITFIYGLRRSELMGLKWNAIDFDNNTITIQHIVEVQTNLIIVKDNTKNKSSNRVYPLLSDVREILLRIKAQQEEYKKMFGNCYTDTDYVFARPDGKMYYPSYPSKLLKKTLLKNNLKYIRFHDLRHSCASMLIMKGWQMKDISDWLGHADINTTMNIYGHLSMEYKRKLGSQLENIL